MRYASSGKCEIKTRYSTTKNVVTQVYNAQRKIPCKQRSISVGKFNKLKYSMLTLFEVIYIYTYVSTFLRRSVILFWKITIENL